MRKMKRMVQRKERERRGARKLAVCCAIALTIVLGTMSPMATNQAHALKPCCCVKKQVIKIVNHPYFPLVDMISSDVVEAALDRANDWLGDNIFNRPPTLESIDQRYNAGHIDANEREQLISHVVWRSDRELWWRWVEEASDVSFSEARDLYLEQRDREADLLSVASNFPPSSELQASDPNNPFRPGSREYADWNSRFGFLGPTLATEIISSPYSATEWHETWEESHELNALIQEFARIRGEYTVGNSHWGAQFMDPSNRECIARAKEEFMNGLTPSERMALGLPWRVESSEELVEEKTKSPEPPSSTWTVDENNASTYYTDCEPGVAWTGDRDQEDHASNDKKTTGNTSDETTEQDSSFRNWNDEPADTIYTDCEPGVAWTKDRDQEEDTSSEEDSSDSSSGGSGLSDSGSTGSGSDSSGSGGNGSGDSGSDRPATTIRQDSNDDNNITRTPDTPGIPAPPPSDNNSNDGTCPIGEIPPPPPANLPESAPEVPEGTVHGDNPSPSKDTADHGCGANQDMTE